MKRILFLLLPIIMAANVNVARAQWEYPTSTPDELPGSGTKEDPYIISTAQELANFAYRVNNGYTYYQKYVVLNADITLNDKLLDENGNAISTAKRWTHIGYESRYKSFKGIFDGQNHTVRGVYTDDDTQTGYVGFFGYVYQATVKNLVVTDSYLSGNKYHLGGIIALATSSEITNCSFHGTIVQGLVQTAGGIVGYSSSCTIDNCHFSGAIRCKSGSDGADYIGGILGNGGNLTFDNTDIKNCTVDADIKDANVSTSYCKYIGGIAGYCYNVINCVVKNSSGKDRVSSYTAKYIGGVVGYASNAVTNSHNSSEVYSVSNSATSYVGGIAGYAYDVSKCCNYSSVTAMAATCFYVGGVVGYAKNEVTDCRNYKTVRCDGAPTCYVGGVAGYGYALSVCANFGYINLVNCSTSMSYSDFCGGGVVGWSVGGLENCFNYGELYAYIGGMENVYLAGVAAYTKGAMKYCVNMGTVTTNTPYSTYALAQYSNYGLGNNNYFIDTTAKSASASEASTGKQPLSFFQSDEEESFISKMEANSIWGVASWGLDPATKLPIPVAWGGVDVSFVMNDKGAGTLSDPYLITNYDELMMLNRNVAKGHDYKGIYFKQTCDFDFAKNTFKPLGTDSDGNWNAFLGHYDGDNHTVKNISYTLNTWFPTGFFAELGEGAEVKNLKFTDNSLTVSAAGKVGMVAGKATKASLSGIYVRDCKINQTLGPVVTDIIGPQIGYNYGAGALAGTFTGNISRCSVYCTDITGNQIGGLAGLMQEQTTVEDAVVQASLHASTYNVGEKSNYPQCAGGITSRASDVKVARCVVLPTVDYATYDSWGYIGGLFGISHSDNAAEYTMCNMNEPENTASRWGHLMGINEGATSLTATTVQIYDKTKYKSSYGDGLTNTDGIKDFVSDLHGWSPIYLNGGTSNLGNMHFGYYHPLPQQGIGSYAVTSANGEYSAYTGMTDYKDGSWTRPANLYIDLSYPEVSLDNNVLTAVGDIDPLIVERKSNVVSSDGNASKLYLYDGKPVTYPSAITTDKLNFSRNFTNTSWQPLYVPFSMNYSDWTAAGLEVASIKALSQTQDESGNSVMALIINKVTDGTIEPNTPYFVKANAIGEKNVVLNQVTMAATELKGCTFSNDDITCTLTPTYAGLNAFNGDNDESTMDYIMKDGKFGKATTSAVLKAQRWYITLSSKKAEPIASMAKAIMIQVGGEGGATKIDDIQVVTGTHSADRMYDLQGRRLSTTPQKGVYIMNNKKVIK